MPPRAVGEVLRHPEHLSAALFPSAPSENPSLPTVPQPPRPQSPQVVGEVLRHPERLTAALCPGVPPELLSRMRADVVRCVFADCCYSPLSDVAKQVCGAAALPSKLLNTASISSFLCKPDF